MDLLIYLTCENTHDSFCSLVRVSPLPFLLLPFFLVPAAKYVLFPTVFSFKLKKNDLLMKATHSQCCLLHTGQAVLQCILGQDILCLCGELAPGVVLCAVWANLSTRSIRKVQSIDGMGEQVGGREGDWRKEMIKMLSRSCSTKLYFSSLDIVNSCGFSELKHMQRNNVTASFRNSKFYASEVEPIVRRYEKLSTLKVSLNWSTCLGKTVDTLFWLSVMQSVATGHCAA